MNTCQILISLIQLIWWSKCTSFVQNLKDTNSFEILKKQSLLVQTVFAFIKVEIKKVDSLTRAERSFLV